MATSLKAVKNVGVYCDAVQNGATKKDARKIAGYSEKTRERDITKSKAFKVYLDMNKLPKDWIPSSSEGKAVTYVKEISSGKSKEVAKIVAGYSENSNAVALDNIQDVQTLKTSLVLECVRQGFNPEKIISGLKEMFDKKASSFNMFGTEVVGTEIDAVSRNMAITQLAKILGLYSPIKIDAKVKHDFSKIDSMPRTEVRAILFDMLKK